MERRTPWLGYLCVILSAVIFGCMPLGARFLYAQGVTPMSLVLLRNLLSLPILALLGSRQGGLRISRGALLEASAASFFGCWLAPILLFSSYRYLASGMAAVFHFIYPILVVLSGYLLREKVKKGALLCALLCSLGILLLFDRGRCLRADLGRGIRGLHPRSRPLPPPRGLRLPPELLYVVRVRVLHASPLPCYRAARSSQNDRRLGRGVSFLALPQRGRGSAFSGGDFPLRRTARGDPEHV